MAKVLRPIGHEERLSMIEHLDELRSRLIICVIALAIAFTACFIFNHALIGVLNRALPNESSVTGSLASVPKQAASEREGLLRAAHSFTALADSAALPAAQRAQYAQAAQGLSSAAAALPAKVSTKEKPITIGVGEPFMTTLTVCAYFALLFTLPLLIYQLYAFVIPALSPQERRVAIPVMAAAPFLFLIGVVFAYQFVLPPAVHFLQGYNANEFNILVNAKTYYTFEILTMLGIGVAFQMPLGLLGFQRAGIINSRTLTRNWRYAVVIIAVIAAAMPGADPVTTALETAPLVVLYLASIVLLKIADRRAAARAAAEGAEPIAPFDDGLDLT
jgi:sec-independent protein translocase protein TatC